MRHNIALWCIMSGENELEVMYLKFYSNNKKTCVTLSTGAKFSFLTKYPLILHPAQYIPRELERELEWENNIEHRCED